MTTVDSRVFQRNLKDVLHRTQHEPVEITQHGSRAFVLMSVNSYDWLRAAAQRRHRTGDAADVVIDAVEQAEMDAGLMPPDDLLR